MRHTLASLCLAAAAALSLGSAATAATVTVDPSGLTPLSDGTLIESFISDYGSAGPVTLDWAPTSDSNQSIRFWNGGYSGDDAGYCGFDGSNTPCAIDILVAPGFEVTLENFSLGGYLNFDRSVTWDVIDLASNTSILAGLANVLGSAPFLVTVGKTSTTGFRLLFGPDGWNGGITQLTYSYPTAAVPLPAGGLLLVGALGGLALLRRRRTRA